MQVFDTFSPIIGNVTWLTLITLAVLGIWLFGKRMPLLGHFVLNHPVIAALIDLIAAPTMILLIGVMAQSIATQYGLADVGDEFGDLILLVLTLSVAWCFARLVELFLAFKYERDGGPYLPRLQRGLLFSVFIFLGVALFIYLQGYSITGLYISTGAVAALLAFAMQQTLGDLFSGIAFSIEHPFKLGERIRLADGTEGKVTDINWRATRLLAWDKSTLVVPNSELAKQGFTNLHGLDHPYAPWYEVKISADVDPRLARSILLEAALRCDKILKDPLPLVRLTDATTIPYTYMVWVHFPNYQSMFAAREQLFQEIHYALKEVGTQASPSINELRTRRAAEKSVDPPTTILALKMLDIAKSLSDEELAQLAQMSHRETFDAGTVLLSEGEIAEAIDVIIHGVVETSVMTKNGTPRHVDQLTSGQYFGLTSMLMEETSFLQFSAATTVTLIRIDIECLRSVLVNRTDLHDEFAIIMKQRLDTAQDTRLAGSQTEKRFTIRDFLQRMEHWTHMN